MTVPPDTNATPQVVTLKDVYNMVVEVKDTVFGHNMPDMKKAIDDHEERLRTLEKWVWRASGLAAVAGAGLSQIFSQLMER